MLKSVYLTTTEPHCGKSLISLGILEMALRRTRRVAVFRPFINASDPQRRDKNIDLLLTHFHLNMRYEDTFALTADQVTELLAQKNEDEVLNIVIEKYKALEQKYDLILCIGSDLTSESVMFEFDFNAKIAGALGSAVALVGRGDKKTVEEIISPILLAVDAFKSKGCQIAGVAVNRARPEQIDEIKSTLKRELPEDISSVSVIPANKMLASPTIREIATDLQAEVLYGEEYLHKQACDYMVIAMQMEHYLARLRPNALLIVPADRGAIILSALQAHSSNNYPPLAGLLLTTGEGPAMTVRRLLDGLPSTLPILAVDSETFETATKINTVRSYITADNRDKITTSLKLFNQYVDTDLLEKRFFHIKPRGIPPRMFLYNLQYWAKSNKQHIVLPEGTDVRILRAAKYLIENNVVDITLMGDGKEIKRVVKQQGLRIDLSRLAIINPTTSPKFQSYAETFYEIRKSHGMTPEVAADMMQDVAYFGSMMVYKGDADGMVSGAAHPTAHTLRPAFQIIRTKPGFSVVSSVFFMCLEDRVLVYGDCAVVPRPTAEQLAEIAISSADTAKTFGIEPRVAMLSYSSGESGTGEEVERVRAATHIAQKRRPDLLIEGPIQYDAAVDEQVGRSKMPNSKVAGRATVLIFPDLNTGNNTYKAVQRETGAIAIGPVLQGLNKPVNDLSRGCTVEDIINTVAITAIQAQHV